MERLPSNIMLDIFSRVPVKCLARSRCVSKEWCRYIDDRYLVIIHDDRVKEEPTPILYHSHLSRNKRTHSLCFHVTESKQKATRRYYKKARVGTKQTGSADHTYVLEPKEDPFFKFLRKKPLTKSSIVKIEVLGSCNGMMCLVQDEDDEITSLVVVHPLRKECYEVPPFPLHFDSDDFEVTCGLGFDASNNTLKMVCVFIKDFAPASTLVHVFGTNSWREIPQVPLYRIIEKGIFANGCLHWLVSYLDIKTECGRHVTWFDVEKEEFGLIDPPKRMCDIKTEDNCYYDHLVDLNGEVGYVSRTLEVWVLKKKEWVPHCRFDEKKFVPYGYIQVLGCWNIDGDMLIRNRYYGGDKFIVYNLKSGVLHKTNIVVPLDVSHPNIFMHPNKLFSIHGIGTNSFPMKKRALKKSCQRLLYSY
ncbi:F-box domain-containing protein [Artemisia annua]|uniref:F-box domain-containing protein n=1 Tax=Artemisia annua TaxID=35608 RepID=A0A2U1LF90_ARTAN|nr:F-box domain-containing protein [Artemisia annua]